MDKRDVADQITADAQSLGGLVANARMQNPTLFKALMGNATGITTTQVGMFLTAFLSWISGHYGFGWDEDTLILVAAGALVVGGYVTHWLQVLMYRRALDISPKNLPDPTPPTS